MRYVFMRYPGGKFKAVTFSYDDGVRQDLRFAEILDKYNMKGTFNINSGFLGAANRTTVEEIKEHILGKNSSQATSFPSNFLRFPVSRTHKNLIIY